MHDVNGSLMCLLCSSSETRSSLINHIYKHIGYFRHHCKDCNFKAIHSHEIVGHQLKTGHAITRDVGFKYFNRE